LLAGVEVLTPSRWDHAAAMTTFTLAGRDMMPVARQLWEGAKVGNRTVPEYNAIRLWTTYYNHARDVTRALEALARILRSG